MLQMKYAFLVFIQQKSAKLPYLQLKLFLIKPDWSNP
jgi:hypothetical protein